MKFLIIIAVVLLASCNRYCDPVNISNGKSLQHLDSKKFKVRIMRAQQYGNFCKVRYANMKTITDRIYENCDCKKFPVGEWISEDSI